MEQDRDQYLKAGILMAMAAVLEWIIPGIVSPLSWAVTAGVFFIYAILKTVQINRKNKMTRQP